MLWAALGFAASVLGSASAGEDAAKAARLQAANQSIASSNATTRAAKQVTLQNDATVKANVANTVRTGYRVGLLNMQRGLQKKQNAQQGFGITKAGGEALGQVTATAAAAGTIGPSVDAVANDIRMKVGDAQAQRENQNEIDNTNFNTNLEAITTEGEASLKSATLLDVTADNLITDIPSTADVWGNALLSGASSLARSYIGDKMKLGLGESAASNINTGVGSGFNTANWGNY